jgi:cytochrome c553
LTSIAIAPLACPGLPLTRFFTKFVPDNLWWEMGLVFPRSSQLPVRKRACPLFLVVLVLVGQAGCSEFGRGRERAILRGKSLFELHCCGCHNGKTTGMAVNPPVLAGIFRRATLPSGAPATDAQVRATIRSGRSGIMPSFSQTLSDEEIGDIMRYLHSVGPETSMCRIY